MASGVVGRFDRTLALLGHWAGFGTSTAFGYLLDETESILRRDYERRALAGINVAGRAMPPLRSKRKGPYAGATGPPRTPFGRRSGTIRNYRIERRRTGDGSYEFLQGVIDGPYNAGGGVRGAIGRFLSRRPKRRVPPYSRVFMYHERGSGRNPKGRELLGISPQARTQLAAASERALQRHARGS